MNLILQLLPIILTLFMGGLSLAEFEANLNMEITKSADEKFYKADIKDEDMMKMYQKWVETGLSSLMSAVANHKLKRQRRSVIHTYGECSSTATDIPKHARCLTSLLNHKIPAFRQAKTISRLERYRYKRSNNRENSEEKSLEITNRAKRRRRSMKISRSEHYQLSSNKERLTPAGKVAKILMNSMKKIKNKESVPMWQNTVAKIKMANEKRIKFKKLIQDDSEENIGLLQHHGIAKNIIKSSQQGEYDGIDEVMLNNKENIEKMVGKRKKPKTHEEKVVDLVKKGIKLAYAMAGQNTTNMDEKNMKLVSPRFLGLVPEKEEKDELNLVSPSLFSLHDEGDGIEHLTSLPNLLKGFSNADQQLWLDVIMEAAGVNEESEKLEENLNHLEFTKTRQLMGNITNLRDEHGTPLYATKDNITEMGGSTEYVEMFEKLHQSYSKDQLLSMNSTGYTILSKPQIEMLYGPRSLKPNLELYNHLMNMSDIQIHKEVHKAFEMMAKTDKLHINIPKEPRTRSKRTVVLSPGIFIPVILNPALASQPFILSPVAFVPIILSPAVFGAVILSPWLFVPIILSPRVLGSLILSPFALSPMILSPFALHPTILSPGLMSPMILSPIVMMPLILSPQCFTPLILSPMCLAPSVLNPTVGSPIILSPFVLSPSVMSPVAFGGLILSPYALSPVVFSPIFAFVAILSPSFLS